MQTEVKQLLGVKGPGVVTTVATATALEAVQQMAEREVGCLVVTKRDGTLAGIVSERDIFRKVILRGKSPQDVAVRQIMTPGKDVVTVTPADTLEHCMQLMTAKRFRHLPVVIGPENRLGGLISIGDVVKYLCTEQGRMIEDLEHYIAGPA